MDAEDAIARLTEELLVNDPSIREWVLEEIEKTLRAADLKDTLPHRIFVLDEIFEVLEPEEDCMSKRVMLQLLLRMRRAYVYELAIQN